MRSKPWVKIILLTSLLFTSRCDFLFPGQNHQAITLAMKDVNKTGLFKVSTDCKEWQTLESFIRQMEQDHLTNLHTIYLESPNKEIRRLNGDTQTMLSMNEHYMIYTKITRQAVVALLGDKAVTYKSYKRGEIKSGITGLLHVLSMQNTDFFDHWHFFFKKNGNPLTIYFFSKYNDDPVLADYSAIYCSIEKNCQLRPKDPEKKFLDLVPQSPEHLKLKKDGVFDRLHHDNYVKLCSNNLSFELKSHFESEVTAMKTACNFKGPKEEKIILALDKACVGWNSHISQLIKKFQ